MLAVVKSLTEHFSERWKHRVPGEPPGLEKLNRLLGESKRIRKPARLFKIVNKRLVPVYIPAEYWHHGLGVVIYVDERSKTAITVIHHTTSGK